MKYKRSIGILAFFSCLPFSSSYGQSQLEEITVTAERRSESIEKTPLAISAFTGADLKDYGIEKVSDLVSQVPGLRLQEDLMFPSYFIRGAGLQSETTNLNDQDVGVYLDDVFLGAPQLSRGQLFDIDRVEVLKGPQGTLFGKNTSAGLIQYVSKPPTQDYQGYFDYGYGSWARKTINAAVGGPIDDKIRFRVAVRDILSDGWQTDVVTNRHYGSEDNFSLRAQLDADLTDNLLASFKVDYNRQRDIGEQYGFQGLLNPKGKFCTVQQANTGGCLSAGATSLTSGGFPSLDSDPTKVATQQSYLPDDMDVQGYTMALVNRLTMLRQSGRLQASITLFFGAPMRINFLRKCAQTENMAP